MLWNTDLGLPRLVGGCQREEKKREVERPSEWAEAWNWKGFGSLTCPSETKKEEVDKVSRLDLNQVFHPKEPNYSSEVAEEAVQGV